MKINVCVVTLNASNRNSLQSNIAAAIYGSAIQVTTTCVVPECLVKTRHLITIYHLINIVVPTLLILFPLGIIEALCVDTQGIA